MSEECATAAGSDGLVEAGHRPYPKVVRALRDQELHRAVALELERQRAAELQRRREQHGGDDGLTQKSGHLLRIGRVRAQLPPGRPEARPVSAHGPVLEDEATYAVAARIRWQGHPITVGQRIGQLNPVLPSPARPAHAHEAETGSAIYLAGDSCI